MRDSIVKFNLSRKFIKTSAVRFRLPTTRQWAIKLKNVRNHEKHISFLHEIAREFREISRTKVKLIRQRQSSWLLSLSSERDWNKNTLPKNSVWCSESYTAFASGKMIAEDYDTFSLKMYNYYLNLEQLVYMRYMTYIYIYIYIWDMWKENKKQTLYR